MPQDELRSVAPNVYLDCDRRTCDFEYIKTEITFVNYVLDRQSADVQIIVTRQQTGSGGNEYTLAFMGLKRHQGKDATLRFYSKPTDTEDQFRRGFVNVLKQGLIPYVYDTPLAEFISISYAQKKDFRPTPASDPWHYWVFGIGVRGNGEFEDQSEQVQLPGQRLGQPDDRGHEVPALRRASTSTTAATRSPTRSPSSATPSGRACRRRSSRASTATGPGAAASASIPRPTTTPGSTPRSDRASSTTSSPTPRRPAGSSASSTG